MPDESELLAYETGVHLGDGNMNYNWRWNLYRVTYAGNSVEDRIFFTELLPAMLEKLYGKKPSIYFPKNERTVLVVLNSSKVVKFKMSLGLPSGSKSQITAFPRFSSLAHRKAMLRGLADTDFCLYFMGKRKTEPRITATFSNRVFISEIVRILDEVGIKRSLRTRISNGHKGYSIEISGAKNLERWMNEIGFSNPKHLSKYGVWKKFGFCPNHTTHEERQKILESGTDSFPCHSLSYHGRSFTIV